MFDLDPSFGHERLEIFHDSATGVTGIVAIHSTVLGPAMGGLRLRAYRSHADAIEDALSLAQAMTLKNAAAGLDLGGGKAVLVDDGGWSSPTRRAERMRAVGRIVEQLGGRYVTAEDVGTTPLDMEQIGEETQWVAGGPTDRGGSGDPSPATARTVLGAIRAGAGLQLGVSDLAGVRVGVQGVGHVGAALAGLLVEAGADVVLTDAVPERAAQVAALHGGRAVEAGGFLQRELDVLAPCALGQIVAADTVAGLRCRVIAGAANNPLTGPEVAETLAAAGILYVPDFLANCGGIIQVGAEILGYDEDEVEERIAASIERTATVLATARAAGRTPWDAAVELAEARIAAASPTSASVPS